MRIKKQFTQICDSSVDDLQSHNRSPDQSDQDSCTPESSTLFYHVVFSLVSPLLDGPFLISPSRRQRATPGDSHTRTRSSTPSRICPPVQLWPHGCLRDAYEARSPLSSTRKKLEKSPSLNISQPVYPQVGLQYISTHRVSTHDPLARRSHAVSRLAPSSRLSPYSPAYIYRDPHAHPTPVAGPVVSTVSHAYPYGLICAPIGTPCLLTDTLASLRQDNRSHASYRLALPCSLPQVCACHSVACATPPCAYAAQCTCPQSCFARHPSPPCPPVFPPVFLHQSWY